MDYRFKLERYSGPNSKHICPNCGRRKFVKYIDDQTGRYLDHNVGRCDREVRCGYHYPPREFFADNPSFKEESYHSKPYSRRKTILKTREASPVDYISTEVLMRTLGSYDRNNFAKFLREQFSFEMVRDALRRYLIGTWADGRTVFWQIDARGRIHTGKLIAYDPTTGKRIKDRNPSWVHAELKRVGELPSDFSLQQCFFGEHLLPQLPEKVVGLVESEKTAIVASQFIPNYLWVATGGCGNLDLERLGRAMRGRRVVLYPDSSKFEAWSMKAVEARRSFGLKVRISDLLERRLTERQKREDYDIADFLLRIKAG